MVGHQRRIWNLAGVPDAGAATHHCQVLCDRALFSSCSLPADSILMPFFGLDVPAGAYRPAVDDGYFVMLSPLAAGPHTFHFTASGSFTSVPPEVL